jgi:hypothetical protein
MMIGIEAKGVIYYLGFAIVISVVNLLPVEVAAGRRTSMYRW